MNTVAPRLMSAQLLRLAILMPAKNEAAVIGEVVAEVRGQFPGACLIVIDDSSQDATAEIAAKAGAKVLRLAAPLGAWGATQTGMRYALKQGCTICVTMDADGQHLACEISKLLKTMEQVQAGVVIGACPQRGSPARQLAWWGFRALTGFALEDLTSGFRAYGRRAMELLASPRATLLEYQDVGVLLLLRAKGIKIAETSVVMHERRHGKSRVFASWWQVAIYLFQTLLLCLASSRR